MCQLLQRLWCDRSGSSLIEYSLLIGILLVLVVAGIGVVGVWVLGTWAGLVEQLQAQP
jgi:pilus assembly protein Flp/PilA